MELINAIAQHFDVSNDQVLNIKVHEKDVWFTLKSGGEYTCKLSRGKFLKKNSIRLNLQ